MYDGFSDNPYTLYRKPCPNAYVCSLIQMCTGGMVNMTGIDLIGIIKVMKFAYHLTSFEKDFMELQEQISKSNISYPRRSFSPDEVCISNQLCNN